MPLKKGKSKETISKNIKGEMKKYEKTGKIGTSKPKTKKKAQKQAVAIALSKARESGAKIPKKKSEKPDYLDFDKDGNKKEPMKKALKDKKKKSVVKESFDKYINLLVKESFGLIKKKVVAEKVEDSEKVKKPSVDTEPQSNTINKKERIKIQNALHRSNILGGNTKVDSISKGLLEVGNALESCGFNLQMVTGDMILGPQGNILLPFSRKGENPFVDGPEIENSRISFTWENLEKVEDGFQAKKRYEIIAYLT
jgi:hypothetical protein